MQALRADDRDLAAYLESEYSSLDCPVRNLHVDQKAVFYLLYYAESNNCDLFFFLICNKIIILLLQNSLDLQFNRS